MKSTIKVFSIALAAVFILTAAICFGQSDSGGRTFNNTADLKKYLDSQPANSPDKPIRVSMSINDSMLEKVVDVIDSTGKYVSLNITGNALKTIDDSFQSCETFVEITIPNCVTSIEEGAFFNCTSLTAINVDAANTAYSSDNGVLFNKNKTVLLAYPNGKTGTYTIPNSVTRIGNRAFEECTNLTSVTIPNSVTGIGDSAFVSCTSLASVTIPNSVTSIGEYAFGATEITSVTFQSTIPSSRFHLYAFDACGDLRTKYLAGGIGTYKTTAPVSSRSVWTKQ